MGPPMAKNEETRTRGLPDPREDLKYPRTRIEDLKRSKIEDSKIKLDIYTLKGPKT